MRGWAHPRVGGEYRDVEKTFITGQGSSPRGRGIPLIVAGGLDESRLIPAWAGNTADVSDVVEVALAHPRVGGEYRGHQEWASPPAGSSPRGRGIRFPCSPVT